MNCMHDNEVNNISEWNLLHDIINPYKLTQNINSRYSTILHGCMNKQYGIATFRNVRIL